MVRRGLAPTRARAAELIDARQVLVGGAVAERAARLVGPGEAVRVTSPAARRFVSRGGEKLDAALDRFGIDVRGARALDAGASTGGFTDCLLERGAAAVVALDVGRGQLHERLRTDPRVECRERTDVRDLTPEDTFEIVVADLSFISLRTVASNLVQAAGEGGSIVVLVKPQFEVGRRAASKGRGVIRAPELWRQALRDVQTSFGALGAAMMGVMVSPLRGAAGNVEFLVHLVVGAGQQASPNTMIDRAVAEAGSG